MSEHRLRFELNGEAREVVVPAHRLLIELLREDLGLTGTKEGCGVGVCGACSVLVDGTLLTSCLLPALYVDGARVESIEGLARDPQALSPLQDAFIRHGGLQCGICTPGQVVAATALLRQRADPTEEEVRHWMEGNLCRCTGYRGILESILCAARERARGGSSSPPQEPSPSRPSVATDGSDAEPPPPGMQRQPPPVERC